MQRTTTRREQGRRARTTLPVRRQMVWPRSCHNLMTVLGVIIVISLVGAALLAPLLAPHPPEQQHLAFAFSPPSAQFPLGADHLGRDVLSRLLYGGRTTLLAASMVLLLVLLIAISIGLIAGFYGGWIDTLLMRLVDLLLAFPSLILAVAVAGMIGPSLLTIMVSLALVWWAGYARMVRGLVMACRAQEYILAAHAVGIPESQIMYHHIIRNIVGPVVVLASLDMGNIMLAIAGLNFLGLGVQPPTPEWGAMLNDAQPYLQTEPQLMLFPCFALFMAVMGCNVLGDGVRDALDPRQSP